MYRVIFNAVRKLPTISSFNTASISKDVLKHRPNLTNCQLYKFYSDSTLDENRYSLIVNETLESLGDKFSELVEDHSVLASADVTLADGVLTVNLGPDFGTYVINKQTPNKQIWLSSPISGPQRFEFSPQGDSLAADRQDCWVYSHSGQSLHQVLDNEIGSKILKIDTGFQTDCYLGGANSDHL